MPSAALSALLVRVRHPVPRCAFAYKSDGGSSFPGRKEKNRVVSRSAPVMRVNNIHDCAADLLSIVSIKKPMTFLLQSMIIF